jgi:hypothetical protein
MKTLPRPAAATATCFLATVLLPVSGSPQSATRPARMVAAEARPVPPESTVHPTTVPVAGAPSDSGHGITYVEGQLRINVLNSTLAEVLRKVAALTGAKIDIPEGANAEQMPVVELGPGPARQILASLLSESNFDYLIQGSDSDGSRIESVLLLPRGKKDPGGPDIPGRGPRNVYARAAAPPPQDDPQPAPNSGVAPDQNQVAGAAATPPQPDAAPATPAAQPDLSAPPAYGQPLQTNVPKTFPVAPPASFDQQTVNSQLQQMYQQRVQMMQQGTK